MTTKLVYFVPEDIQRHDRASYIILTALLLSVIFHFTIFVSLTLISKISFKEPIRIIPIEVSRIINEPKAELTVPQPQENLVQPEKQEPLPNIIPKKEALQNKKPKETVKPKPVVAPPPIIPNVGGEGEGQSDSRVIPSVEAQPFEQIKPKIPDALKTHEYKSYVRVKVEISADGTSTVSLKTSSENQEIDQRVLQALRRWKWRPALFDGRAVNSVRYFRFEFEVN